MNLCGLTLQVRLHFFPRPEDPRFEGLQRDSLRARQFFLGPSLYCVQHKNIAQRWRNRLDGLKSQLPGDALCFRIDPPCVRLRPFFHN